MKKNVAQFALIATALLADTAAADSSTGNTVSRGVYLASDGSGRRFAETSVDGTVTVMQEVSDERRVLQATTGNGNKGGEVPFPPDGAEVFKTGAAIHFKESTALTDVECFVFEHVNPDHSFKVCESNGISIDHDEDAGVADIQLTGFNLGEYKWWVEDSFGSRSAPQTFTVKTPKEVVRRSERTEPIVSEAEWTKGGEIVGSTGRIYYSSYGVDYACTGTVIKDHKSGRSLIVTAAHCVWDDIDGVFGR